MHGEFPFISGYDFRKSVHPGLSYPTAHSDIGNRPGSTANAASPIIDNASGNIPGSLSFSKQRMDHPFNP
jgi:hypothetical protein